MATTGNVEHEIFLLAELECASPNSERADSAVTSTRGNKRSKARLVISSMLFAALIAAVAFHGLAQRHSHANRAVRDPVSMAIVGYPAPTGQAPPPAAPPAVPAPLAPPVPPAPPAPSAPPAPPALPTPADASEAQDAKTAGQDPSGCAATGAGCLTSQCCSSPGDQCYTKNAFWAQCMNSCTKGPNPMDQVSPSPWECQELGKRTPGEPKLCSKDGEDCTHSQCCTVGGAQCYEKDQYWAACKPACVPGPDLTADDDKPWSCRALGGRTPGAAPWVAEKCAQAGADCKDAQCCAEPGTQCYKQSDYYAQCKASCTPGEKANPWEQAWSCEALGARTPQRADQRPPSGGKVGKWVEAQCSADGQNCLESQCCHAVGGQCYTKNEYWAACKTSCSTAADPSDGNLSWTCNALGPKSWGLAVKGYPSLYCFSLFMPSGYEGGLMGAQLKEGGGIFSCDGYDVYAAEPVTLGTSLDGVLVQSVLIPKVEVGVSQDGTAGNAKLFMAVWDKVIAGGRFRDYDFTCKVDPDAVLIAWRLRDHMRSHIGKNVYVVNCNKFPSSPNFPMMYGALEVFTQPAMVRYAESSWKCGQQLPWALWGEDYYMTHCMDFIGVGRIGDFGILGDNVCTGANCADSYTSTFHPFKAVDTWLGCWNTAKR